MRKINNDYGIDFYYENNTTIPRVVIFDSNKNYFENVYYENDNELAKIINFLKHSTFERMCDIFNMNIYESIEQLSASEFVPYEDLKDNEYVNVFNVNGQLLYTWSWIKKEKENEQ